MNEIQIFKPYDLEERTFQFAKAVRIFVKTLVTFKSYGTGRASPGPLIACTKKTVVGSIKA